MRSPWNCFYKHFSRNNVSPLKLLLPAFQQLECFPLEVAFYTRTSAIRMFFLKLFLTSFSAVRTLPRWNYFLPAFQQLECFPPWKCFLPAFQQFECFPLQVVFYTSISAVGILPPWNCFLPAFPQIEWFPFEIVFTSISAVRMLPSISAVRMFSPSSCTNMYKNACVNIY